MFSSTIEKVSEMATGHKPGESKEEASERKTGQRESESKGLAQHGPKVLIAVSDGCEEIETITMIDTLKVAGADVTIASVENRTASYTFTCKNGTQMVADKNIQDCCNDAFEIIACPGGNKLQWEHMRDSKPLGDLLNRQNDAGKYIAGICSTPANVFVKFNVLGNHRATGYPHQQLQDIIGDRFCNDNVCVDGNLITSQGPGTALPFSLKMVELLMGEQEAHNTANKLVASY